MVPNKEKDMTETEIDIARVRQVVIDALTVLGLVLLLAVELA